MITALNKIDLLDDAAWLGQLKEDFSPAVAVSALFKQNLDLLMAEIEKKFSTRMIRTEVLLAAGRMDLVDLFYREGKVEEVEYLQKGIKIKLNLPKILFHKLLSHREIREVS